MQVKTKTERPKVITPPDMLRNMFLIIATTGLPMQKAIIIMGKVRKKSHLAYNFESLCAMSSSYYITTRSNDEAFQNLLDCIECMPNDPYSKVHLN